MTRKAESERHLKKRLAKIFKKKVVEKTPPEVDKYVKVLNREGKVVKVINNGEKYL